jgi:hypothetical protein
MFGKFLKKKTSVTLIMITLVFGIIVHLPRCGDSAPMITRGAAASIIAKECSFKGNASVSVRDVETLHKHYTSIMACISRKVFGELAVENYNFHPDAVLTQYELAKLSVYLYAALLCVEDENIAPGGRLVIPNMENLSPEKKWYVYCAAENGFISTQNFNPGFAIDKATLRACVNAVKKKAGITGADYETYAANKLANFRSFPVPDIPLADKIDVFPVDTRDRGIKLLSSTLQGLVNRDTIRLFLDMGGYDWMPQYAIERSYFSGKETALDSNDWVALLKRYAPFIRKAIVWDTNQNFSVNFCVNIAAVEDRALLTDNMVETAKQIIPDLDVAYFSDYRIDSQLEAQRYNYENEFPHLRRDVIGWNYYAAQHDFLRDYSIQMKMPTMWVPGNLSPDFREETLIEATDILQKFPATIPMLGFGYAHDNINGKSGNYGLDEFPAVKLHGEYGKYTAVFDIVGNLSFHSPIKISPERKRFNQTNPESISYDNSKKYVAITMTESGDSPAYIQYGLKPRQWKEEERGTTPYSMCYGLLNYDMFPLLTEYFASTQTSKNYMFGAISGLGYNYPLLGFGSKGVTDDDGILYMNQEMIMKDHYTKANDLCEKLNFKSLGIYSFPASKWSTDNYRDFDNWVAQYMPFVKSFVGDMHRPEKLLLNKDELYVGTSYGQNIFHCSTFWYIGPKQTEEDLINYLVNEIVTHTTYTGELYHCMAYSWHYGPRRIKQVMDRITQQHPEYVFVTVDQLDLLQGQRR